MSTTTSRTVTVAKPLEQVWTFLSDFSTSAEWDPHTVSCRKLDDGPVRVGTRFENVQHLAGHDSDLTYTVTQLHDHLRIVLEGGNDTLRTRDEMVFAQTPDGGTEVTYTVDVQLLGLARAGQPLVPAMMKRSPTRAPTACPAGCKSFDAGLANVAFRAIPDLVGCRRRRAVRGCSGPRGFPSSRLPNTTSSDATGLTVRATSAVL